MKNKKGISLIVLVITIIIIIILAAAIILSLTGNNPVENSKEATFKNDLASIKDLVNLASTDILLEKPDTSYKGIIPAEYTTKLGIEKGILYYIGEDAQEEEWAKEIGVIRKELLPADWIDIAENTPENGISLLIGKSETSSATIKFKVNSTAKYSVDWGDGSSNSYIKGAEASHTYSTNSSKSSTDGYLFEIKITPESGNITRFQHTQTTNSPILWCQIGCDTLTSCEKMLYNANKLKRVGISATASLNKVTNMAVMFGGCSSLKTIPKIDTSQVRDMFDMFEGCSSLTEIPLLDTSNVEDMEYMFDGCKSLKNIPLLDTSSVTSMQSMFGGCSNLTNIPKLETSQVTNMVAMFSGCSNLISIPELNTSNVIYFNNMFSGCNNLKEIPKLDTSQAEDMQGMFLNCSNLKSIPLLDISQVTYMSHMLLGCDSLKSISIANTGSDSTQINKIFDELPELTNNPVIDITGNPGAGDCTRTTATGKGWTVIP